MEVPVKSELIQPELLEALPIRLLPSEVTLPIKSGARSEVFPATIVLPSGGRGCHRRCTLRRLYSGRSCLQWWIGSVSACRKLRMPPPNPPVLPLIVLLDKVAVALRVVAHAAAAPMGSIAADGAVGQCGGCTAPRYRPPP